MLPLAKNPFILAPQFTGSRAPVVPKVEYTTQAETFEPSAPATPVKASSLNCPGKSGCNKLKALMMAGTLALMAIIGAPGLTSVALAAEGPPAFVQMEKATAAADATAVAQIQGYGLSATTAEKVARKPALMDTLKSLPDSVIGTFSSLTPGQKMVLTKELYGKSTIVFKTIVHKDAFITGKAMGLDAFPTMLGRIDDHVKKHEVTPAEAKSLKETLEQMKPLSVEQRKAIFSVLEMEFPPVS